MTRLPVTGSTGGGKQFGEGAKRMSSVLDTDRLSCLRHIQGICLVGGCTYVLGPLAETGGTDWVIVIETTVMGDTLEERRCACSLTQSCPTLCNPVDCSLPGSSAHGTFQARILEWVAISFSRGSS